MFVFLWQVKIKRKPKSADKDSGPTSPTVPSITYDSVFDSGRELSSDVYSTVGTGTVRCVHIHANQKNCLHSKRKHSPALHIKGPVGVKLTVKHIGTHSDVAPEAHEYMKMLE